MGVSIFVNDFRIYNVGLSFKLYISIQLNWNLVSYLYTYNNINFQPLNPIKYLTGFEMARVYLFMNYTEIKI